MATVVDWVVMCASEPEFVQHYNRLYGANVSFEGRPRSAIEAMVDRACAFQAPPVAFSTDGWEDFTRHCIELWALLPEVRAQQPSAAQE